MLVTLLVFILLLGILVFIHELGHFIAAKRAGVKVMEFAFGFQPRIFGKTVGETTYALNAIPLGGYVRMYGEDPKETGERSYRNKTIWQRFIILLAGALMNFLFGWVVLSLLFIVGFSPFFPGVGSDPFVRNVQSISIQSVQSNSPAQQAGLTAGDQIIAVNGIKMATDEEFVVTMNQFKGQSVNVTYQHLGTVKQLNLLARATPPTGQGPIGVAITSSGKVSTPFYLAPFAGLYEAGRILGLSVKGFVGFIAELAVKQRVSEQVTGLIGVGALTGVARRLGIGYLLQLAVMVSIGLSAVNLMPILPLDGGHIAALIYEKIARRPLSDKQFNVLATAGLAFVILLFVIVTYKDILRFNIFGRFFS